MVAGAEARAHDAVGHRLAHQELLRALAGLVVVVDDAVVGGLEAIEFLGLAADRSATRTSRRLGVGRGLVLAGDTAPRRNRPAAPCAGNRRRRSRCGSGRRSPGAASGCAARSRRCSDRAARRVPSSSSSSLGDLGDRACSCWRRRPRRTCRCRTARPPLRSRCRWRRSRGSAAGAGRRSGASRMRSFWPSFRPPSRPRAPSAAAIALISSGVAPSSRRIVAMVSPFFTVTVRSFQALPPVAWLRGLRQQRDVLRHDARLEAGIGIGVAFGRIGERGAAARLPAGSRPDSGVLRAAGPVRGVAHARDESSIGTAAAILARGRTPARSRVTKETSASGSAPGCSSVGTPSAPASRQQLLRD